MLDVEGGLEHPVDQDGDPGGGPQRGPPAMGLGPLLELVLELLELGVIESRLWPGVGPGGELLDRLLGLLDPSVDGGPAATEEVGDLVGGLALLDKFDGPDAAALEFFCDADRSGDHW